VTDIYYICYSFIQWLFYILRGDYRRRTLITKFNTNIGTIKVSVSVYELWH